MRTNIAILLAWVLLLGAFTTGCTGNAPRSEAGEQDQAQLKIRGNSGTGFSGSCAIGDKEPEPFGGQVPESFTYDLEGRPLDCEISSEGGLQVELTVGENVHSVGRISGGTLNLAYENGSISSASSSVYSSSGSSRQASSTSSQSSSSSQVTSSSAGEVGEEPSDPANGPGNVVRESRDVSGFNEVELEGVGDLSIGQTGGESLTVVAEKDVLSKIRTEVENDRLVIGLEPDTTLHTTGPINYKLTVKELDALELSGSGDIDAEGISADNLAVNISGAGDVTLRGRTNSQDIYISGAGEYRAEALKSEEAEVDVGGSGSAIVNVREKLEAEVSGSGTVEYIGDPTVEQDVSGAGEVSQR